MDLFFRISGDGNCLYNAVSMHLVGDESLNLILRLLSSVELFSYCDHYKTIIDTLYQNFTQTFPNKMTMLNAIFRFSSTKDLTEETHIIDLIKKEAVSNCEAGSFSSLVCILGLSSVIGTPIRSIYSPRKIVRLFPLFTQTFCPRKESHKDTVHLLWCTTDNIESYTKPNHFTVCLDTRPPKCVTGISSISEIGESVLMQPLGKKRQITLEFVPNKKTKVDSSLSLQSSVSVFIDSAVTIDPSPVIFNPPAVMLDPFAVTIDPSQVIFNPPAVILDPSAVSVNPAVTNDPPAVTINPPAVILDPSLVTIINPPASTIDSYTVSSDPVAVTANPASTRGKSQVECNVNDIGLVRRKLDTMTDQEIFEFLNDVWKPPQQYTFPQHEQCKRKWRFNPIYVTPGSPRYYPWLVYSRYYDGVFCLPCVVFGNRFPGSKLQKLYTEPLTRWNGASTKFLEHQKSCQMHHDTVAAMETFKSQLSGKSQRIDVTFDTIKYERIRSNRQKLIPILKTVILCARQNISFRGHRDDSKHFDDRSNNPGNFQTLLEFRVDSGDRVLDDHFKTAPKNATYRSKSIQNELIESCGKHIRQKISKEIQSARFFSVIADEASDCSQTEQLSLVISFIDENSTIREEFVEFVKCESTSAEYLTNKITQAVENLSLNMRNLRGQAYDGAGNMAGSKSGVSTRIRNVYPKALYFHCSTHRLNLAVASSSSIRGVKNMMDSIGKCSEIFYFSPKKKELLKRYTLELMPEDRRTTLLNVCKTRWLQRIDGLARVQEMIEPILTTLDLIATNHDGSYAKEARSDAQGVYWTFKSFQFAIHLIIVRNVISYTNSLTYELQEKQLMLSCHLKTAEVKLMKSTRNGMLKQLLLLIIT